MTCNRLAILKENELTNDKFKLSRNLCRAQRGCVAKATEIM